MYLINQPINHFSKAILIALWLVLPSIGFGQITSATADYVQPTQYTNNMPNDEIFVFCSPDINGNPVTGELTASPTIPGPGYTFEWGLYDETNHTYTTFQTDNGATSTVNGLASGGYSVTITNNNGDTETFITWVYVSIVDVDIALDLDPTNPGCEPFDVNGTIDASGFTYWDPVDPGNAPFIIDQNTTIEVCFNANHTYVSDLGFVLVGPPSCGSPGVTLIPNPQVVNNGNGCCCNSGNNINNLCFTTASNTQLNVCGSGTPLSGTYGFYNGTFPGTGGGNYPQGGVPGLYGCNAAEGGWAVQIYDCIGADVGALTGASITFSNGTSTIVYDSGPINSGISDNSCDPNSASIYVVPLTTPIEPDPQQVPNSGTLTYQLGLNGNPVTLAPGTNTFTETVDPIPNYDEWYYLTIQDQLGCAAIDSAMFDFTGYADATIDDINANNQLCVGSNPVQLTAATAGGTWSGTGVSATGMFDPAAAGVGVHTITYTIPAPCGDVQTIDITVGNLTVDMSSTASICTADNGTATATPTSGVAPFTYTWDTNPAQTDQTATDLAPGDYDVTVEDSDGCAVSTSVNVPFDASDLSASIVATTDVLCNGDCNGTAEATGVNGTPPYTYVWDDPNAQTAAIASDLCTGTFGVEITDANGCIATEQTDINEPDELQVSAAMLAQSDCGQPNGEAEATAQGGVVATDYQWTWDSAPVQTNAIATGLEPATYTITAEDDNGCTASATVDITSTAGITLSVVTTADALCNQSCDGQAEVEVGGSPILPVAYSWNTVPAQQGASVNNLCAGTFEVTCTDDVGCVAITTVTIGAPLEVVTTLSASENEICIGESSQLNALVAGGTSPYAAYEWTANPADPTLDPTLQNPTVSPVVTTTYTLVVTDANGCESAPKFITVEVLPPLDLQVIRPLASPDTGICPYDFTVIDLLATGGDGNYTYFLEPDNINPVQLPMSVQPASTTTYTFTVEDGCTTPPANAASTITVFQLPVVDFAGDLLEGCDPHTTVFTDLTTPEPDAWSWNFGDANSQANASTYQNPSHVFSGPGLFDVSLEVTTADGCVSDSTKQSYVEVFPTPVANFEMQPEVANILDAEIDFTDLSAPDIAIWNWNFGTGETSEEQNPSYMYPDTGIFVVTLVVETSDGCIDRATRTVEINPDFTFYIPNSFTPNNDGRNDVFRPYGEGVDWDTFEMSIYNRWGEEIFLSRDIETPWDGTFKGSPVEMATYVYRIVIRDKQDVEHIYRDGVTVVR